MNIHFAVPKRFLLCAAAAAIFVSTASAQRSSIARQFPIYDNGGKPDLTVDPQRFTAQMDIVDRYFEAGSCAITEEAVGGSGYRRLLRFDTVVLNRGDGDVIIGDRADPANPYKDWFFFHDCHGHYHLKDFSIYELIDPATGQPVAKGTKQGFCFEDSFKYEDGGKSKGYDCDNQGITSGWGDWYYKQLVGQWIDITGVKEGDYIVRVTINWGVLNGKKLVDEGKNEYPNVIEARIHVPDPRKKVDFVTE